MPAVIAKNKVVAIIGDGAMTNGLSYEAINNLGFHKTQLTIILNDNTKSISDSVGALSTYLSRIITNPTYNHIRSGIWSFFSKVPFFTGAFLTEAFFTGAFFTVFFVALVFFTTIKKNYIVF